MITLNIDIVQLAVKIGYHNRRVDVVGENAEETKKNLLKLFVGVNDKKNNN